jgi:Meckel syndrome type 1 protein
MARPFLPFSAAAASLCLLAGCAADGPYPSLAQRPAEKAFAEERDAPDPVPPQPAADPALVREAQQFVARAEAGRSAFDAAYDAAAPLTARAGAPGSEIWVQAQQAVSRVVSAEAETARAMADLDQLAAARASAGTLNDADAVALRDASARVQAIADSQAGRLQRLEDALRAR